jgi:recombination protein RecA
MPAIDRLLPDGGLPLASVVEIAAPAGLGRSTQMALAACASAQRRSLERDGQRGWCAWIDGSRSLYAPGVLRAGVDLQRLLIAQPEPDELARVAVRVVSSRLFSVVVIDRSGVPGAELHAKGRWNVAVRRLALAAEGSDTIILLLSSSRATANEQLPTALRIELSRPTVDRLHFRIAKERRGRLSGPTPVPLVALHETVPLSASA